MHPQGVDHPTFRAGPLDGSLSVPQLIDLQLERSPNHVAYIYDDTEGEIVSVTFSQYIKMVHASCRKIMHETTPHRLNEPGTVIAVFATMDTISYCMLVASIMRAGLTPFFISPRTAAVGLADLLAQTNSAAVYISPDSNLLSVLSEALVIWGKETQIPVFDAPTFDHLHQNLDLYLEPLEPLQVAPMDRTALILHTSGSTSIFSKPIYYSHKKLLQSASVPWSSAEDRCGQILGVQGLQVFHGFGVLLTTWPFSAGLTLATLRPRSPPIALTPENALNGIIATKPELVLATPAYIEYYSHTLAYIGAPLNRRIGDDLVASGVVLCSIYGTMETGLVTPFFMSHGKDWDYFSVCAQFNAVKMPEEDGSVGDSALYTHTYVGSESYAPGYTNTEVDGRPGCAVSDLLEPHPDNPALQRVYGRKDEQIWFSNRARMNPGPVEAHINRNPLVDAALVFGHGRTHPGVLIQLKEEFRSDVRGDELGCDACDGKQRCDVRVDDREPRSRIFDAVWASVQEGNQTLFPQFQIQRKMVVFATAEKPFPLTSKLQPRRRAAFEQYEEEISSAYS
ncbi:hypothetical protein C8R43DRAFT_1233492 [Mycena crocata]|nr:hypothetical protein C8R43DRAFT_1233492 [Mycena crocata]